MGNAFYKGEYAADGSAQRGWFLGNFCEGLRKTSLLEIKYWTAPVGQNPHEPKTQRASTEVSILIRGKVRGFIGDERIELSAGQYLVIPPGIRCNMLEYVDEEAEGFCIKAPSLPDDTIR
jgi:mannose-6-phosphate isomerase-like protein (cupin superfamily)